MSLEMMIYLASISDRISWFLIIVGTIASICFIPILAEQTYKTKFGNIAHGVVSLLMIFSGLLLPSEKTVYAMAAANVSKEIVQSKDFKTLYGKTYQLIEKKLDDALDK